MSLRQRKQLRVIAFDPGVTTGVAVVDGNGNIRYTAALDERLVKSKAKQLRHKHKNALVIIEVGPIWRNDNPLTRTVESEIFSIFPEAELVTPNLWKRHPAAKCTEKLTTTHERDAVRLGRWFLARRVTNAKRQSEETNTT
jgi:predicted RNase H-like nuclease (RuvC/YqgF family)